jgi:hypothetical protein
MSTDQMIAQSGRRSSMKQEGVEESETEKRRRNSNLIY